MNRRMMRAEMLAGYGLVVSFGFLPALVSLIVQLRGASAVQWSRVLSDWMYIFGEAGVF